MLYSFLKSKKGFTVIELLVAVTVLGILVAVAVPVFDASFKKQKKFDCRNQCLVIETAVKQTMTGMVDNGRKQDKIGIENWDTNSIQYTPSDTNYEGPIFNLSAEEYRDKYYTILDKSLTIGQIRGGYNPDYSYESCEATGKYLKKERLADVAFYEYLNNAEIPVCPFADETNSQGYSYCIFEDGTVCCTCPECNEID